MGFHLVDCRPVASIRGTAHSAQPVIADELDLAGWIDVASRWFDYHFRRFGCPNRGRRPTTAGGSSTTSGGSKSLSSSGGWLFVQRIRRGQEVERTERRPCSGDSQGRRPGFDSTELRASPLGVSSPWDSQSNPWAHNRFDSHRA